jgi:integrase
MKMWTPEQLRESLASQRSHRRYAAWMLIVTTGMRRGEVLGLSWDHVDLSRGRLSGVRSLTVVTYGHVEFSEPKTAKGRRSIALDRRARGFFTTSVGYKGHRTNSGAGGRLTSP